MDLIRTTTRLSGTTQGMKDINSLKQSVALMINGRAISLTRGIMESNRSPDSIRDRTGVQH